MKGTITHISDVMPGKTGHDYHLVTFKLESGETAKTYVVPTFRNFPNWRRYLDEGTILQGIAFKKKGLIDGDSPIGPLS